MIVSLGGYAAKALTQGTAISIDRYAGSRKIKPGLKGLL